MKFPMHAVSALAVLAASIACSSGTRTATGKTGVAPDSASAAASELAMGCTATLPGLDVSTWRTVKADGFTFCAPMDWKARGRTLRRSGASVSWGTGAPPRNAVRRVVAVERVVVSSGGRGAPTPPASLPPSALPPNSDSQQFAEKIDGRLATLHRNRFDGTYYTGARWDSPDVWLVAESSDPQSADLTLNMMRTVRFVSK